MNNELNVNGAHQFLVEWLTAGFLYEGKVSFLSLPVEEACSESLSVMEFACVRGELKETCPELLIPVSRQ